ncbi:MAG: hypothetical protein JXA21_22790 [Anaerolineae bacterium]|nr:hypothetical protein [Anaerolineae bacterium]
MESITKTLIGLTTALLFTLGVLALSAPQAVRADGPIYVDKDAPGPVHDGTSWATAYTHPQTALDNAAYGDEIWVAEGIYTPTHLLPTEGPSFFLYNSVALYGGFAATETLRTQRNWNAHITVLSGDLGGDDITDAHGIVTDTDNIVGTNAQHVVFIDEAVTSAAIVDGFFITAGKGSLYGGGIRNRGRLTLNNLTIIGNQANSGGGIANGDFGDMTLTNVIITHNRASTGGGIINEEMNSRLRLNTVTLLANTAGTGGGVTHFGDILTLENVIFENNRANNDGGGLDAGGTTYLTRTTFISNTTTNEGGGMYCDTSDVISLDNVTFISNTAQYGGGLYKYRDRIPDLHDVSFIGNTASQDGGGAYLTYDGPSLFSADSMTFTRNHAGNHGGGLYTGVDHTLTHALFNGNTAGQYGGALYADQNVDQSRIGDATFDHNTAEYGGAVYLRNSDITLDRTTFSNNEAAQEGGAFYNFNWGENIISNSTFNDNIAQTGGALVIRGTTVITHSSFSNNLASGDCGAARLQEATSLFDVTFDGNTSVYDAGALAIDGKTNLKHVTFSNNEAGANGGGLLQSNNGIYEVTLNEVVFSHNTAGQYGGGLHIEGYSLALENVIFHGNAAQYGGGMMSSSGDTYDPLRLTGVTFSENSAERGGGLHYDGGLLMLNDAMFYGNNAAYGGGLHNSGGINSNNLVFSGNTGSSNGGGIYLDAHNATFTNLSVFNNMADNGGGLYAYSSYIMYTNSIFWGNQANDNAQVGMQNSTMILDHDLVQDGCPAGATCTDILDADPLVARAPDPGDGDWSTLADNDYGDLRLRPASPAIDAGDDAAVTALTDLDGNPRIMGAAVDLGAYEVEIFTLTAPAPGVAYDFAPNACGSIAFSATGTLPASLVITLTHAAPTANNDGLARRYDIAATGGSGYNATLTLCYEDEELAQAGIPEAQEPNLHLYRWDQNTGVWIAHSRVDPVANRITADNVTGFGVWGIGVAGNHPTAIHLIQAAAHPGAYAGLILLSLLVALISKPRRQS